MINIRKTRKRLPCAIMGSAFVLGSAAAAAAVLAASTTFVGFSSTWAYDYIRIALFSYHNS